MIATSLPFFNPTDCISVVGRILGQQKAEKEEKVDTIALVSSLPVPPGPEHTPAPVPVNSGSKGKQKLVLTWDTVRKFPLIILSPFKFLLSEEPVTDLTVIGGSVPTILRIGQLMRISTSHKY